MDDLASWLGSIVWPLVSRALKSLGLGFLVFEGADAAVQGALAAAKNSFGAMPGDVASLVARFGFFDFMAITAGGIVSGLAWMYMKRIAVVNTGSA